MYSTEYVMQLATLDGATAAFAAPQEEHAAELLMPRADWLNSGAPVRVHAQVVPQPDSEVQ